MLNLQSLLTIYILSDEKIDLGSLKCRNMQTSILSLAMTSPSSALSDLFAFNHINQHKPML